MGAALMYVDRRTDRHDGANRSFPLYIWTLPSKLEKQQAKKLIAGFEATSFVIVDFSFDNLEGYNFIATFRRKVQS